MRQTGTNTGRTLELIQALSALRVMEVLWPKCHPYNEIISLKHCVIRKKQLPDSTKIKGVYHKAW